jgi:Kef-type K+ transport system membrane component KefB
MEGILVTLGLMIIVASIIALIAKWLEQPLLLGYVVAGILLGPAVTGLVENPAPLLSFVTELGLIFLMFIIGLELDLSKLKDVGKVSAMIGIMQVVIITLICSVASMLLDFTFIQGLYIGLAVSFSSTIVVVKILTEVKEIDSLHGELALGILVIQDVLAVIGLSLLGTLKGGGGEGHSLIDMILHALHITLPTSGMISFGILLLNFVLFALVTFLFYKYVMPRIFKEALSSTELLFVVSLAVVLILSAIAGLFAFSLAMGAFLAGIALSTAPYSHEILGRVKPLKDFFLLLFFVSLGMQILFGNLVSQLPIIIFILVGALLVKPIVTFFICKLFKYNNRTSFFVSLHLAQVSEFGLVLIASGITSGVMPASVLTGVVIVTIFTMVLTAYLIKYDEQLYTLIKPIIAPLDYVFGTRPEEHRNVPEKYQPQLIIIGVNPMTAEVIEKMPHRKKILVIDYNPRKIISYKERGIPTICTDALNIEIYESIDFSKTETVVSVVHEMTSNLFILKTLHEISKKNEKKISIIMSASTEEWGKKLYRAGATLVLMPDVMGRRMLSEILSADDPATIRNIGRVYYEELHKNFVFIREI